MNRYLTLAVLLALGITTAHGAISAEQAQQIALAHAGGGHITEFDYERGIYGAYYEIEVKNNGVEYEFKIDASSGNVFRTKVEPKVKKARLLPIDQIRNIALRTAGGGRITDIDLERRLGYSYYEVEVRDARGLEHEIKINATTGAVISHKIDD